MEKNQKKISIKNKIILIISFSFIFFSALIYLFSTTFLLNSFTLLENEQIIRNLDRVSFFLKSTANNQDNKIKDWAFWDDTYEFINNNNKDYIKSNLTDETLISLKINTIIFINDKDEIIYSKFLDLESNAELPDTNIISYLNKNIDYIKSLKQKEDNFNIIKFPEGDIIISVQDILKSDATGPSRGTIIFGTIFNSEIIKNINEFIKFPVTIYDYEDKEIIDDIIIAKNNLSDSNKNFINILSNKYVAGYSLINDINNKPIDIIKIEVPRDIYNQGLTTTYTIMLIFAFFIFLIGLFIFILIKRYIISRITILDNKVNSISDSSNFENLDIKDLYNDEISSLIFTINNMLLKIKKAKEKEKILNESEKAINEQLKKHMDETEKLNKLMIGRELKMIEMKKYLSGIKEK